MLHVRAQTPNATFAGLDPRTQDVQLQIRNAAGELTCCTIPASKWMRLYRRTFGFWDQLVRVCPPVKDFRLKLPKRGQAQLIISAARLGAGIWLQAPVEFTMQAGNQCAQGQLTIRSTPRGAKFP